MPELRCDPVVGYWTIISTERGRRPVEYREREVHAETADCPFCEGRESETTPEIFAIRPEGTKPNQPGWDVRAVLSKVPLLSPMKSQVDFYGIGLYDVMDGVGQHELIIESPKHKNDLDELSAADVEKVVRAYVSRFRELERDERFEYSLLFKNHGHVSGALRDIVRHSRSQLISMPITPKRVKEELVSCRNYFERRERCVFCDILNQEKRESSRIVAENEAFFCLCPFASRSPFEMWILPKKHSADFGCLPESDFSHFASILKEALHRLQILLEDPPFNFILHTAPYRHLSRQSHWQGLDAYYHWYLQISPRLTPNAGFEWGTGIHINPTPPEDAAYLLRGVSRASVS